MSDILTEVSTILTEYGARIRMQSKRRRPGNPSGKAARKYGRTLREIARGMTIYLSAVSRIFSCIRRATPEQERKIADFLKITVDELRSHFVKREQGDTNPAT